VHQFKPVKRQLAPSPLEVESAILTRGNKESAKMNIRNLTYAASALALGLATLVAPGQLQAQPLWDRVDVNLPYSVTIGDKILQPGNYVIQQLDDPSGGSQVLLIYGDNGMKFQTSALTIPALENRTQPETRVVLHHIGNDYYFDKVWVAGKDYGYEFPLPNSVKMREKEAMQPVSVAAAASSVPAQTTQAATTTQSTMQQQTTTPPATTQQATTEPPVTTQQATTEPPVETTMPPATENATANRVTETPAMPHTSAGWLMMLISGGALSGLGAKLKARK
jgi:hypothetical protein